METRRFGFDKLVRDEIPARIESEGGSVEKRILDDIAYINALKDKAKEELTELDPYAEDQEILSELADIEEALSCLKRTLGFSDEQIEAVQIEKNKKFGSFTSGLYIETADVASNSAWIQHFANNPDQYPEITTET